MTNKELLHAMGQIDPRLIANAAPDAPQKKTASKTWIKWAASAACFALIVGSILLVLMPRQDDPRIVPSPGGRPNIPTANSQVPSGEPQHYGSSASARSSDLDEYIVDIGMSVTAQLIETLPDTYTFFDDWSQCEYRLLRMKTVKLLKGKKMTEEFYYMVPAEFMTDFTLYDRFVIVNMSQFAYEFSVLYNKTQGTAERLDLVLFGYRSYGYHVLGEKFIAFDSRGKFDERLWTSNEAWLNATEYARARAVRTIRQAEKKAREGWGDDFFYVHLLEGVTGEAADALSRLKSFENGIFVPIFNSEVANLSPEVQFIAVRYIDGFATNEIISIRDESYSGGGEYTVSTTRATFNEEDMKALPDLSDAVASVISAHEKGEITPPHISNYGELEPWDDGVFGWYAKTTEGVIGVVQVTWRYWSGEMDDAYFIIEYGDEAYRPIDRDELLEKYDSTYVYSGEYDEHGKILYGQAMW